MNKSKLKEQLNLFNELFINDVELIKVLRDIRDLDSKRKRLFGYFQKFVEPLLQKEREAKDADFAKQVEKLITKLNLRKKVNNFQGNLTREVILSAIEETLQSGEEKKRMIGKEALDKYFDGYDNEEEKNNE